MAHRQLGKRKKRKNCFQCRNPISEGDAGIRFCDQCGETLRSPYMPTYAQTAKECELIRAERALEASPHCENPETLFIPETYSDPRDHSRRGKEIH